MKTSKYHILSSWLLLICFTAGQYMVYAHQHHNTTGSFKIGASAGKTTGQTLKEKCSICDAMHHTSMEAGKSIRLNVIAIEITPYSIFDYKFTSLQIISASGRAPPSPDRLL